MRNATQERKGKSTAIHARVLAPSDVTIHEYPSIPDFDEDPSEVLLLFPSDDATPIEEIDPSKVKRVSVLLLFKECLNCHTTTPYVCKCGGTLVDIAFART